MSRRIGGAHCTEKTVVSGVVMMGVKGSRLPTLTWTVLFATTPVGGTTLNRNK